MLKRHLAAAQLMHIMHRVFSSKYFQSEFLSHLQFYLGRINIVLNSSIQNYFIK